MALGPVETLRTATALYLISLSCQVMSEPGLQNLLMARMAPGERAGAWAANLLLMFATQALVAQAAGAVIAAYGYQPLFFALGATGLAAAAVFALAFSPPAIADGHVSRKDAKRPSRQEN